MQFSFPPKRIESCPFYHNEFEKRGHIEPEKKGVTPNISAYDNQVDDLSGDVFNNSKESVKTENSNKNGHI